MSIVDIAIIIFIILESLNVFILYYAPDFKHGNGVGVFKEWERTKENEASHLFAKYMKNWVAGTKLIFIALLAGILFLGNEQIKLVSAILMVVSIATYFQHLHPIIKKLDEMGEITPKGYSKTLWMMVFSFLTMFLLSILVYLIS